MWESNTYSYAANNPLTLVDPNGLKPITDLQVIETYNTNRAGKFLDDYGAYIGAGNVLKHVLLGRSKIMEKAVVLFDKTDEEFNFGVMVAENIVPLPSILGSGATRWVRSEICSGDSLQIGASGKQRAVEFFESFITETAPVAVGDAFNTLILKGTVAEVETGEKVKDSFGEFASNLGSNIHDAIPEIHFDRLKNINILYKITQ